MYKYKILCLVSTDKYNTAVMRYIIIFKHKILPKPYDSVQFPLHLHSSVHGSSSLRHKQRPLHSFLQAQCFKI